MSVADPNGRTEVDLDWTSGEPRVLIFRCDDCAAAWYLPRLRCPRCLGRQNRRVPMAGGLCVAVTSLHSRGAADTTGDTVGLCLVESDDGAIVMGRTRSPVRPGDAVRLSFSEIDGRLLPTFEVARESAP